ncbi:hypothetical protein GGC65_001282 [Sphingopyxis sp. OAS728]|uniref:HNH endonuclease n=1 Tax=Sphingopyxis sp. OAS728 TaxID=2663823 RepID=UPI00178AB586|nr:HNH endonuclease [Sphingopyxis sp. OAS728]MBE1526826.1 hypothetical protein [Sphingopyxis sp. OAS728]
MANVEQFALIFVARSIILANKRKTPDRPPPGHVDTMARTHLPTPEALHTILSYDAVSGRLSWRARDAETLARHGLPIPTNLDRWNARYAGTEAAQADDGHGYRTLSIGGRLHKAQRVVWAMHYGRWPTGIIRFVGADRRDLRISNLRAPVSRPIRRKGDRLKNNRSGVTGVHWHCSKNNWRARIHVDGKCIALGEYVRFEDAVRVRREAELRYRPAAPPN